MNDLTTGSVGKGLLRFALPYLLACFLQTFYGMVDMFVVGRFNGASTTTAVSIGSQMMHMATVMIAGFAMGITVHVGRAVGAKEKKEAEDLVKTGFWLFLFFAVIATIVLFGLTGSLTKLMRTPLEAVDETKTYLGICFLGIPCVIAFNYVASIFRGAGDSRTPLCFVGIACLVNIALDFYLVGALHFGAKGAAIATVCGQTVSVLPGIILLLRGKLGLSFTEKRKVNHKENLKNILGVGAPIALQDGLIQVSFLIITMIANSRGLIAATGVGIVEKLIGFFFLVPSAFLSALSTVTAQNMGARKPERAHRALFISLCVTVGYGFCIALCNQFVPELAVGLFTKDAEVLAAGCEYMRSYVWDVMFAAIHFCFSGYFCGNQKSAVSFVHNMVAIVTVRIPGAYVTSRLFPETLYPMGWAAPIGSIVSAIICIGVYIYFEKKKRITSKQI